MVEKSVDIDTCSVVVVFVLTCSEYTVASSSLQWRVRGTHAPRWQQPKEPAVCFKWTGTAITLEHERTPHWPVGPNTVSSSSGRQSRSTDDDRDAMLIFIINWYYRRDAVLITSRAAAAAAISRENTPDESNDICGMLRTTVSSTYRPREKK